MLRHNKLECLFKFRSVDGQKRLGSAKHTSLFCCDVNSEEKSFMRLKINSDFDDDNLKTATEADDKQCILNDSGNILDGGEILEHSDKDMGCTENIFYCSIKNLDDSGKNKNCSEKFLDGSKSNSEYSESILECAGKTLDSSEKSLQCSGKNLECSESILDCPDLNLDCSENSQANAGRNREHSGTPQRCSETESLPEIINGHGPEIFQNVESNSEWPEQIGPVCDQLHPSTDLNFDQVTLL
jgi:hypothetical protein